MQYNLESIWQVNTPNFYLFKKRKSNNLDLISGLNIHAFKLRL
jgi:hypothetical protein